MLQDGTKMSQWAVASPSPSGVAELTWRAFPYEGENVGQFFWELMDQPTLICWLLVPDEDPVV